MPYIVKAEITRTVKDAADMEKAVNEFEKLRDFGRAVKIKVKSCPARKAVTFSGTRAYVEKEAV